MVETTDNNIFSVNDPKEAWNYFRAKLQFTTGPVEVKEGIAENADINIIDVRQSEDFDKEHIPGAANLSEDEWNLSIGLSPDRLNVIYCYSRECHLAARAAMYFAARGYPVMEMEGGFEAWKERGLPLERGTEMRSGRIRTTTTHETTANARNLT